MKQKPTFLLLSLFLLLPVFCLYAVHPQVRNFTKKQFDAGTQNWDILQSGNNWMYFANNNGLLEYNGWHWELYPIGNYTNVRSLHYAEGEDRIYAGAFNEFGYYERDSRGVLHYTTLTDLLKAEDADFKEIWNIDEVDGTVFFQGGNEVFLYKNGAIKRYGFSNRINSSAVVHGMFVVSVDKKGVFLLSGEMFLPLPGGDLLKDKKVCGILPLPQKQLLFVTDFDGLYLFDGEQVARRPTDLDVFMREHQVFCAAINQQKLAIGTVRGGVVVIDMEDNSNVYSNVYSGLQNNTVLSLMFDNLDNLWVGLDKGIDYVMINSPVYDLFANNQLYGSGYTSLIRDGRLYMGTNQGLYSMRYPMGSSYDSMHVELVPGMQGQVWSLKEIDHTLFCGTDYGAYMVHGDRVERIGNVPGTWNFIPLETKPGYILGSAYDGFFLLKKRGDGKWVFARRIRGFNESGGMFEEDKEGNIWFSHWMKGVFKLTLNDAMDEFAIELFDTSRGFYYIRNNTVFKFKGDVVFSGDGGFFRYDAEENKMKHAREIEEAFGVPPHSVRLIEMPREDVWVLRTGSLDFARIQPDGSYDFDRTTFSPLKTKLIPGFEHFNLIDNSHLIVNTEEGFSWIDLSKVGDEKDVFKVAVSNVYLTAGRDSLVGGCVSEQTKIPEFEFRNNSLRFEFVAAEYRADIAVNYSCRLDNYDSEWSTYSAVNTKEYTKLPGGEYVFRVRAQSSTSAEVVETSYRFVILPPWYQTWVAFAGYAVLLILFVIFLLVFINKRSQEEALKIKKQKEEEMQAQELRFREEKKEQEQEIINLKNQKLRYELRHKSRDLANSTMNLIRKNEILLDINNNLDKIASDIKHTKEPVETLKRIAKVQSDIKKNIERDDNWKKFEANFDMVYENYLKRLGEEFPVLTVGDKKLCAYLKMGLSSKDIAPLLNMSFRSVEMSRYRLRKKLNLNREDNLTEFLQNY